MKQIKYILLGSILCIWMTNCGSNAPKEETQATTTENTESAEDAAEEEKESENPSYDPNRGLGKFTEVAVGEKLDGKMAESGKTAYDVKCSSCHKLTEEKLVGPGWAGVSKRRTPVWIMNFITNTDAMIDKDPAVQAQLEICLVRMPNQSLGDEEARGLLEFMRKNDGFQ